MRIEVLYFDGCPNHEAVLPRLRELLADEGIYSKVELRRITDDETAKRERFLGSPTIRVNGLDVEPDAERRTDYGMKCRLYRVAGGVSGQPPEEWLRAALNQAARGSMGAEPQTALGDSPINGPSFADRAGNLAPAQRALYKRLLTSLIAGGPPPLDPLPGSAAPLIDADLVQAGDDGRLAVAYPFPAAPTHHRVTLHDGRSYHAMCAIDALGIPHMLGERGEVEAHEPDDEQIIRVTIDPEHEPAWTPAGAVAVVAFGDGCCLAQSACPHLNLFAAPDAAARYLETHKLRGNVLSIMDAATAGRWLFGDLLQRLTDDGER